MVAMTGLSVGGIALVALAVTSTIGVSAGVDARAVLDVRSRASPLILAFAANLLLLPLAAWYLARAAGLPETVGLGLVLAAAAPAGSTGPLLAQLAGGAPAVGIALFTGLGLVASAAVPLVLLALGALEGGHGGAAVTLAGVVGAQLGPVALGMWVRRRWPSRAPSLARGASRAGLVLLVAVIAGYVSMHGARLLELRLEVAVASAVTALSLGFGGLGGGLSRRERVAVSQVSAIRNLSLALLLVELLRLPGSAALGVLAYGLPMYVIAGVAAGLQRRWGVHEAGGPK
jgi:BASS family bile acid:Na+ symporter